MAYFGGDAPLGVESLDRLSLVAQQNKGDAAINDTEGEKGHNSGLSPSAFRLAQLIGSLGGRFPSPPLSVAKPRRIEVGVGCAA